MSFEYLMEFSASDIAAASSNFIEIFQAGKYQEVKIIYAKAYITIPSALSTADYTKIIMEDVNGGYDATYASTPAETAAGSYTGDGDVVPDSNTSNHTQWGAYPRLAYPAKIVFQGPEQSGDTGGYYLQLLCREMQGSE